MIIIIKSKTPEGYEVTIEDVIDVSEFEWSQKDVVEYIDKYRKELSRLNYKAIYGKSGGFGGGKTKEKKLSNTNRIWFIVDMIRITTEYIPNKEERDQFNNAMKQAVKEATGIALSFIGKDEAERVGAGDLEFHAIVSTRVNDISAIFNHQFFKDHGFELDDSAKAVMNGGSNVGHSGTNNNDDIPF